jgi:hypothetical protein
MSKRRLGWPIREIVGCFVAPTHNNEENNCEYLPEWFQCRSGENRIEFAIVRCAELNEKKQLNRPLCSCHSKFARVGLQSEHREGWLILSQTVLTARCFAPTASTAGTGPTRKCNMGRPWQSLLESFNKHKDLFHDRLDEFGELGHKRSKLCGFKGAWEDHSSNPMAMPVPLADLLKHQLPTIADPQERLRECQRRAQEFDEVDARFMELYRWLVGIIVEILTPVGMHFGMGLPDCGADIIYDVTMAEVVAFRLRVYYDRLCMQGRQTKATVRQRRRSPQRRSPTEKQLEVLMVVQECKLNFAEAARRLKRDPKTVRQYYDAAIRNAGRLTASLIPKPSTQYIQGKRGKTLIAGDDDGPAAVGPRPHVLRDRRQA